MLYILTTLIVSAAAASSPAVTTAEAIRNHMKYFASDELEGRLAGSKGERLAGDYAKKWFQDRGLLPAGTAGTYFQEFDATLGQTAGPAAKLEVITSNGERLKAQPGADFVPLINSKEGNAVAAGLVFAGQGIVDGERNDYASVNAQGKFVIVVPSSHDSYNARAIAKTAKAHGAAGVLFVGTSDKSMPLPTTTWPNAISRETDIIAGAITLDFFEQFSGMSYDKARRQAQAGRVMPGFAQGVRAEVAMQLVPNKIKGRSVIALLPGTDAKLKNQYIVIGAHMDHVGHGEIGSASGTANIHNGADDNASGCAGVLELAKYLSETKSNRKSVLFMLYSGEELGLLGSSFYVKNPIVDIKSVTAMFNMDMIGNLTADKLTLDGVRSSPSWPGAVSKLTEGYDLIVDPTGRDALGGRSDHGPWEGAGVPVLFFYTGEHERYHRDSDKWNLLNYEGVARVTETVYQFIKAVDEMPGMPAFQRGGKIVQRPAPEPSSNAGGPTGRRVRVGLIPDYADPGPGLLLSGVSESSPAERAGLKAGDRILTWAGKKIASIEDLQELFMEAKPGEPVRVTVMRNGKEITLTITPEEPEAATI